MSLQIHRYWTLFCTNYVSSKFIENRLYAFVIQHHEQTISVTLNTTSRHLLVLFSSRFLNTYVGMRLVLAYCIFLYLLPLFYCRKKLRMAVQGKFYLIAPKLQSPSYLMVNYCLSVYLSVWLAVYLSVWPAFCLFICASSTTRHHLWSMLAFRLGSLCGVGDLIIVEVLCVFLSYMHFHLNFLTAIRY